MKPNHSTQAFGVTKQKGKKPKTTYISDFGEDWTEPTKKRDETPGVPPVSDDSWDGMGLPTHVPFGYQQPMAYM